MPAVRGGWRKGMRHEDADFLPLTPGVLAAHLKGEVHIGLYPLLDGDRCWWLAADFDGGRDWRGLLRGLGAWALRQHDGMDHALSRIPR